MKKLKKVISFSLVMAIVLAIQPRINTKVLADSLKSEDVLYITENDNIKETETIEIDEDNIEVKVQQRKSSDLKKLSFKLEKAKYKNVIVDRDLSHESNIKEELKYQFENGSKIVFRGENMTVAQLGEYFELDSEQRNRLANIKNEQHDILKVVGVSIEKENSGAIHTTIIRTEKTDSEEGVTEALLYSLKKKYKNKPTQEKPKDQVLSFGTKVNAAPSLDWREVDANAWCDKWTSVWVSYSIIVQASPNNPVDGIKYYSTNYSEVDIDPQGYTFYTGDSIVQLSAQYPSTIVSYGPKDSTNASSISYTISVPANFSITFQPNQTIDITKVEGGLESYYTRWKVVPKVAGLPTNTNKTISLELSTLQVSKDKYFMGYFKYTVPMYTWSNSHWTLYGTASSSSGVNGQ